MLEGFSQTRHLANYVGTLKVKWLSTQYALKIDDVHMFDTFLSGDNVCALITNAI